MAEEFEKRKWSIQEPIITPTTKADNGEHDADISEKQILCNGIVTEEDMSRKYTKPCFKEEQKLQQWGLIWWATNEFGKTKDGKIVLIDEIHTRILPIFMRRILKKVKGKGGKQLSENLFVVG
jgi:phosphoribosylaminoimidazole-succinocarboxamide synthase